MDVGVIEEVAPPGMEYHEEADLRPKVFRIPGDCRQGLGGGTKEGVVALALVGECEMAKVSGEGEHHVKILDVEEVRSLPLEPLRLPRSLTLWAMAIAAGVVRDLLVTTALATPLMAAKGFGATESDVSECSPLLSRERSEERRVGKECRSRWSPYH